MSAIGVARAGQRRRTESSDRCLAVGVTLGRGSLDGAEGGHETTGDEDSAVTATADVVIVGAGIMGVSTAYHLVRRGAGRVVILERDDVCAGSTALASGGIRHQYANRIGIELTRHSIRTYE